MEIKIRPLQIEDAKISYKWRNDPEVFKYTGAHYDHEIAYADEANWIKKIKTNKDEYRCAILIDDEYIGNIYLTDIENGSATYHIFIGNKSYWGKGIATEASRQIIEYGFNELNLNQINLKVKHDNIAAKALYVKLGFKEYDMDDVWLSMRLLRKC